MGAVARLSQADGQGGADGMTRSELMSSPRKRDPYPRPRLARKVETLRPVTKSGGYGSPLSRRRPSDLF